MQDKDTGNVPAHNIECARITQYTCLDEDKFCYCAGSVPAHMWKVPVHTGQDYTLDMPESYF